MKRGTLPESLKNGGGERAHCTHPVPTCMHKLLHSSENSALVLRITVVSSCEKIRNKKCQKQNETACLLR